MIGATICSGIGAPEVAGKNFIDWQLASEIEPFPRAVLANRHGYQEINKRQKRPFFRAPALWGDFTSLRVRHMRRLGIPFPNIIVAGTPCQSFSLAGKRQSLSDQRGNLTLEFIRLIHAIRQADESLRYLIWENVPGVLSTHDNAFGCLLGGLVGADDPLFPDDSDRCECGQKYRDGQNIKWPSAGMVAGPFARLAWRVLDAQYFGMAQRRARVFVVAGFRDWTDPSAILFERIGMQGNSPPSRKAGKNIAPTIASRPTGGGGLGIDFDCDGGLITDELARCDTSRYTQRLDHETETFVVKGHADNRRGLPILRATGGDVSYGSEGLVAHSLRADGFDASEDGTGRGTPLTVALRGREGGGTAEIGGEQTTALRASQGGGDKPYVLTSAVRRLTPRECARLQGFPDDYLDIIFRGKPAADGLKYKSLGNAMAVPVVRWILSRIEYVDALLHQEAA